jgi:methyl-accepting chemotaxis protein
MSFSGMKVSSRLALVFGTVITVLIALATTAYVNMGRLATAERWNAHTYQVIELANGLLTSLINMETGQRGFSLSGKDAALEPLVAGRQRFEADFAKIKELTSDNPAQQDRLQQLHQQKEEWLAKAVEPAITLRRAVSQGSQELEAVAVEERAGRGKQAMDAMRALLSDVVQAESALLEQRRQESQELRAFTRQTLVVGSVLALGLAAGMGLLLARSLRGQLGGEPAYAAAVAKRIAAGDLSTPVDAGQAARGSVIDAMNEMQQALRKVVASVRQSSDNIATGSVQIATGNSDLSHRTEEQASNLQQTAASMEQLTSTVKTNADTARQATQLAGSASTAAAKGGEVVSRVVTTMDEITASSKRIADIIGVIDGIAFQTNILALNAAVEAARAGEQGRGFAVVAGEVRNLAQRSADAAKEIKTLISTSVERVEVGSKLVSDAGTTMDDIVTQVKRVADLIAEISAATTEQTSGIGQVSDAVTQLDQMTQQNAALVEESAAAADSLRQQAQGLVQAVSVFRLDAGGTPGTVVTHAPVASKPVAPRGLTHKAPAAAARPTATRASMDPAAWETF